MGNISPSPNTVAETIGEDVLEEDIDLTPDVKQYIDYREPLKVLFPEIAKERSDALKAFSLGLNLAIRVKTASPMFPEHYVLPVNWFKKFKVNQKTFYKMNLKYPIYYLLDGSYDKEQGIAKKWECTENFRELMILSSELNIPKKWMKVENGERVIVSDLKYPKGCFKHDCIIDLGGLKSIYKTVCEKYEDGLLHFNVVNQTAMLINEFSPTGVSTQVYRRINNGRLFNMNAGNIQTVKGSICEDMFHGAWRYDAKNAHYTLATKYTDHDAIHWYAEQPDVVRKIISERTGLTTKEVKTGLLMILYGVSKNADSKDNPLAQEVGKQRARKFFEDPDVVWISKGVEKLGINLKVKMGDTEGKTTAQQVSHWLNILEGKMLDCAIEVCPDVQGLYFDGIVSRTRMDVQELSAKTTERLGVHIRWTEEQIGY